MEGLLVEFNHRNNENDNELDKALTSLSAYKVVPWLKWEEWSRVQEYLFSSSPDKITFALNRISAWRSRGCLPVIIDVTAAIIEIQQKDPFYRKDVSGYVLHSEQMMSMLYCMAILRLVNCVIERTRSKTGASLAKAAEAIGIPRTLIDIRHEGSHRELPALPLVRDAAVKALDWLKSYYWEPQAKLISTDRGAIPVTKNEIKRKIREIISCLRLLNMHKSTSSSSSKRKRRKLNEEIYSSHKFFSFLSGNVHSSTSMDRSRLQGVKMRAKRSLKSLADTSSSSSSSVLVTALLDLMITAAGLSDFAGHGASCSERHASLDDVKLVIIRLAEQDPCLLLKLVDAVLCKIIASHGDDGFEETDRIARMYSMFSWLVEQLKGINLCSNTDDILKRLSISRSAFSRTVSKSVQVSLYGDNRILDSTLLLASFSGSGLFEKKIEKMCSLLLASGCSDLCGNDKVVDLSKQEQQINDAEQKLEMIRLKRAETKSEQISGNWTLVKSWNPCPIGCLPNDYGSAGRVPDLDFTMNVETKGGETCVVEKSPENSQADEEKQDRSDEAVPMDDSENAESCSECSSSVFSEEMLTEETGGKVESDKEIPMIESRGGHLMMNGVRVEVGEELLRDVKSRIRVLF